MTGEPWIVHLSEGTRLLVRDVLDDLIASVGTCQEPWRRLGRGDIGLLVPKAARLRIGRRGARFVISDRLCRVSIPDRGATTRERLLLSGRMADSEGETPPGGALLRTLQSWRSGLSTPVDSLVGADATRFVTPLALLGRGLAERLERPWFSLRLQVGEQGVHALELNEHVAHQLTKTRFNSHGEGGRAGSMSAPLITELDRLRGTRLHAWEEPSGVVDGMPHIHFGSPPPIYIWNDGDVITAMRAIAATPAGAGLLP